MKPRFLDTLYQVCPVKINMLPPHLLLLTRRAAKLIIGAKNINKSQTFQEGHPTIGGFALGNLNFQVPTSNETHQVHTHEVLSLPQVLLIVGDAQEASDRD